MAVIFDATELTDIAWVTTLAMGVAGVAGVTGAGAAFPAAGGVDGGDLPKSLVTDMA